MLYTVRPSFRFDEKSKALLSSKAKIVQFHQTGLTNNDKSENKKAKIRNMKIMEWESS